MLCDIGSRDVRELREEYERARNECFKDGNEPKAKQLKKFGEKSRTLLDELARVASLLFTVEEGTHAVVASRVPFVQDKFRTFIENMGLSDLLENVNKRRQRLEQRLHEEMSRLLQGRMERLAETTDKVGRIALLVGGLALAVAILAAVYAIILDEKVGCAVDKYLGGTPSRKCVAEVRERMEKDKADSQSKHGPQSILDKYIR